MSGVFYLRIKSYHRASDGFFLKKPPKNHVSLLCSSFTNVLALFFSVGVWLKLSCDL
jgi:hypothetical protein